LKQKFISNLIFLIFLNLLIKPLWIFGIERTIQNTLGSQEYGLYFALFNYSLLFDIILDLGISNFNNKNISQNNKILSKHFSAIIILKLILAAGYFIVTLSTAFIVGYRSELFIFLLLLAGNRFMLSLILYFRSNIAGLQMFRTDSIISILDKMLVIIFCGLLLSKYSPFGVFKIEMLVYSQGLAYLITLLFAGIIITGKTGFLRPKFDFVFMIAIIKKILPFAVLFLLMTSYTRIDAVMIERILPDGNMKAGIYAQGYRILDAFVILGFLFAGLLLPMFSKMLKNKENIAELTKISFFLLLIPITIISISLSYFSKEIISLLYIEHTEISFPVFRILILCLIPISISYIFGTLLTADAKLKHLNRTAFLCLVINIVLNFIFIPIYGIIAAAYSVLITQSFSAAVQFFLVYKIFDFRFSLKEIIKSVIVPVFTLLCLYISDIFIAEKLYSLFVSILLSSILALLSGIVDIKDLIKISSLKNI